MADAGRDGRTVSRNQILRRDGDRNICNFPVQLTVNRIGPSVLAEYVGHKKTKIHETS